MSLVNERDKCHGLQSFWKPQNIENNFIASLKIYVRMPV